MTTLSIFGQSAPKTPRVVTEDAGEISNLLADQGIRFERWSTRDLPANASQEDILAAYADDIQGLKNQCGFQAEDVISLNPDNPQNDAFRQKFIDEHVHSEDEIRFFVRARGLFYPHLGDQVFAVLCQKNDLISVPHGTRHWFDMGPEPAFTCIRLFTNPDGWIADFTGETIAVKLPGYESLKQATA